MNNLKTKTDYNNTFDKRLTNVRLPTENDIKYIVQDFKNKYRIAIEHIRTKTDTGYQFKIGDETSKKDYYVSMKDIHKIKDTQEKVKFIYDGLIKQYLPDLLKDCKTIDDIEQKLKNIKYKYDNKQSEMIFTFGDIKFNVPIKSGVLSEDKKQLKDISKDIKRVQKSVVVSTKKDLDEVLNRVGAFAKNNDRTNYSKCDRKFIINNDQDCKKEYEKEYKEQISPVLKKIQGFCLFDEKSFEKIVPYKNNKQSAMCY